MTTVTTTVTTPITTDLQHYELTAEWLDDSQGRAIMLTQADGSGCNEPSTILLDMWQLRAVCERFGVASDPQSAKTIATLQRRMLVLERRITHLANYLDTCTDRSHANLDYETDYAYATAEIAAEFVADFAGDHVANPVSVARTAKDSPQPTQLELTSSVTA